MDGKFFTDRGRSIHAYGLVRVHFSVQTCGEPILFFRDNLRLSTLRSFMTGDITFLTQSSTGPDEKNLSSMMWTEKINTGIFFGFEKNLYGGFIVLRDWFSRSAAGRNHLVLPLPHLWHRLHVLQFCQPFSTSD